MIIGIAVASAFVVGLLVADTYHFLRFHWPDPRPARVSIRHRRFLWRIIMATLNPGQTDALKVVVTNKAGRQLLPVPSDTAVKVDTGDSTVSAVDLATGNFVFTAGQQEGTFNLTATTGSLTSAPYPEVVQDNVPATVSIQPQ